MLFEDDRISQRHCKLVANKQRGVILEDMSSNGTFVDGIQVGKGKKTLVPNGSVISLVKTSDKVIVGFRLEVN